MADVVLPDWLDFQPRLFPRSKFAKAGSSPGRSWSTAALPGNLDSTLGLLPGEAARLFNTHCRSDYVGGNARLAERFPDANPLFGRRGLGRQCQRSRVVRPVRRWQLPLRAAWVWCGQALRRDRREAALAIAMDPPPG